MMKFAGLASCLALVSSVDGAWGEWDEPECSVSCGAGTRQFARICSNPDGGKDCAGEATKTEDCNLGDCPVSTYITTRTGAEETPVETFTATLQMNPDNVNLNQIAQDIKTKLMDQYIDADVEITETIIIGRVLVQTQGGTVDYVLTIRIRLTAALNDANNVTESNDALANNLNQVLSREISTVSGATITQAIMLADATLPTIPTIPTIPTTPSPPPYDPNSESKKKTESDYKWILYLLAGLISFISLITLLAVFRCSRRGNRKVSDSE